MFLSFPFLSLFYYFSFSVCVLHLVILFSYYIVSNEPIYNAHNTNINKTYVTIINLLTIHDALNSNGNGILVTRNKLNGDKR